MSYGILAFLNMVEGSIIFKTWIPSQKYNSHFQRNSLTDYVLPGGELMSLDHG